MTTSIWSFFGLDGDASQRRSVTTTGATATNAESPTERSPTEASPTEASPTEASPTEGSPSMPCMPNSSAADVVDRKMADHKMADHKRGTADDQSSEQTATLFCPSLVAVDRASDATTSPEALAATRGTSGRVQETFEGRLTELVRKVAAAAGMTSDGASVESITLALPTTSATSSTSSKQKITLVLPSGALHIAPITAPEPPKDVKAHDSKQDSKQDSTAGSKVESREGLGEDGWSLELSTGLRIDLRRIYEKCLALEESRQRVTDLVRRQDELAYSKGLLRSPFRLSSPAIQKPTTGVLAERWQQLNGQQLFGEFNKDEEKVRRELALAQQVHARIEADVRSSRPEILQWMKTELAKLTVGSCVWVVDHHAGSGYGGGGGSGGQPRALAFMYRYRIANMYPEIERMDSNHPSLATVVHLRAMDRTTVAAKDTGRGLWFQCTLQGDSAALSDMVFIPSPVGDRIEESLIRAHFHDPEHRILFHHPTIQDSNRILAS